MDICAVIGSQSSHLKSLIHLLKIYQRKDDLILRISFTLGNLTAKSVSARNNVFSQNKALETILYVGKYYLDINIKTNESRKEADEKSDKASKSEDVLIKLVRVIANLSINEETGQAIANSDSCVRFLMKVLNTHTVQDSEELVLNTLATFNNLAFHKGKESSLATRQLEVAKCLLDLLNVDHIEGMTEANRVYGNLSRDRGVRDFIVKHKGNDYERENKSFFFRFFGICLQFNKS